MMFGAITGDMQALKDWVHERKTKMTFFGLVRIFTEKAVSLPHIFTEKVVFLPRIFTE